MPTKLTLCHAAATPPALYGQDDAAPATDREEELRALMAMASHDLKNPLASVTAHVTMLREDYGELGENFRGNLAAIERGLRRMSRLTQGLLDYARADRELDLHPTPLNDMVSDIVADYITTTGAAQVTVVGMLPTVIADSTLLHHVLDNLIGNAIKYTPADAAPEVEIRAHTLADGTTRVEVTDHGIGIPRTEQLRIFDAFYRCVNSTGYPGTGLGLNICQRIIERHSGRIGVVPNPGGGSRFWFTLPTQHEPPRPNTHSSKSPR